MKKHVLLRLPVAFAFAMACVPAALAVNIAHGQPTHVHGHVACSDLGLQGELVVRPFTAGTYSDASGLIVQLFGIQQRDAYVTFDWSSNGPVGAVVVEEDGEALIYTYNGATGDTDVAAPGLHPDSVTFCYHHKSAVDVRSFTARRVAGGTELTWRVSSESGLAGYNVYSGKTKLNRSLVAAGAGLGAHSYHWLTRWSGPFRLQALDLNGNSHWYAAST